MRREGSNILITLDEWLAAGLSYNMYENDRRRGYLQTANRAGNGRGVEIIWGSIVKEHRKAAIAARHGKPELVCSVNELEQYIVHDEEAKRYFTEYELPNGQQLGAKSYDKVEEYYANAIVLAAAGRMLSAKRGCRRSLGGRGSAWDVVAHAVNLLEKYPHTLPSHERRLRDKYAEYQREGLACFIHKSFGNSFARVVDERLERLILSIYCMGNKPYASWVHEDYLAFVAGLLDVVDMKTGELMSRDDFFDEKKGTYMTVSESTCRNYVNNPKNRAIVEALRSTRHQHTSEVRPHYHRHAPRYSLSKISLDDRDLPRRTHDGNRVKGYYAYDVCSGAIIGAAYSDKKDKNLFVDCLRDMFRFIDAQGYGVPLEVEVEHHLAGLFKDDLLQAGVVFPFVRWCAAGNSQEKHAEQFNRRKKYMYEKREQPNVGRFYARSKSNRTCGERVYNEEKNCYEIEEKTYTFEELVADDRAANEAYNSGPHRDRELYAGKSCMEVLREQLNPNLAPVNRAALARYIGERTDTTIRRNMYVRVQYADYMLPSPEILGQLAPNGYAVEAFWLPPVDGKPAADSVFVYQKNTFVAECKRIEAFTTANAEWTEADTAAMAVQAKYIKKFDTMVKEGTAMLSDVKLLKGLVSLAQAEAEAVGEYTEPEHVDCEDSYSEEFQVEMALENL